MKSTESAAFDSFESKKILPSQSDQPTEAPDETSVSWSSKTPEKPINPPRPRTRRAAMSLKEVRQFAEKLRKPTPDKSNSPHPLTSTQLHIPSSPTKISPPKKSYKSKLPEKYEILDKFFSSLDSSIRLLNLKGSMPSFTNISPKIECLTDRRFTHAHLAQLKFVLPEAIEIEKILVRDERTSCMKPDLHVTLNVNAFENDEKVKSDSGNLRLRKVFRARLFDLFRSHPEVDEVPEETLPVPFNQSKQDLPTHIFKAPSSSLAGESSNAAVSQQQPIAASHLSHFFKSRFSKKVSSHEAVKFSQESSMVFTQHSVLPLSEPHFDQGSSKNKDCTYTTQSPIQFSSKSSTSTNCLPFEVSPAGLKPSHPLATPVKKLHFTKNEEFSSMGTAQVTPSKLTSTPARLMSATPALQPQKRCYMSPDDDSTSSPNKLVRRPLRSRSLKFDTPVKNPKVDDEVIENGQLSAGDDIFDILPNSLLQSIREKERKALEEQSPAISQAKRRQQMIASLPKLFDMLNFLFQSIKRSIITKQELMHKIISSHLDIVDRREVEDQLRLLQELVPEWIYEKPASSGDLLICINKTSSPESMRARLAEAK